MSNQIIRVDLEPIDIDSPADPIAKAVEAFRRGIITEAQLETILNASQKRAGGKRDYCNAPGHDSRGARLGTASARMNANLLNADGALRSPRLIAALAGVTVERVRNHLKWLKDRNRLFVD